MELLFMGRFSIREAEKILKMDDGDGCITM
jgi:hypothetical protein